MFAVDIFDLPPWLGTLVGCLFLMGAIHFSPSYKFVYSGRVAQGTIVKLKENWIGNQNYTYYPVIKFKSGDGRYFTFTDNISFTSRSVINGTIKKGTVVPVEYIPEDPKNAYVNYGWQRWEPSGGLTMIALLFLGYARKRRNKERQKKKIRL